MAFFLIYAVIYFRIITGDNSEDKEYEEDEEDENQTEHDAAFCSPEPEEEISVAEAFNCLRKFEAFLGQRLDTTKEHLDFVQKLKNLTLDSYSVE